MLSGVDFDLTVQDSATSKRYTLLRDHEVIDILIMDSSFTDHVVESINKNKKDN